MLIKSVCKLPPRAQPPWACRGTSTWTLGWTRWDVEDPCGRRRKRGSSPASASHRKMSSGWSPRRSTVTSWLCDPGRVKVKCGRKKLRMKENGRKEGRGKRKRMNEKRNEWRNKKWTKEKRDEGKKNYLQRQDKSDNGHKKRWHFFSIEDECDGLLESLDFSFHVPIFQIFLQLELRRGLRVGGQLDRRVTRRLRRYHARFYF